MRITHLAFSLIGLGLIVAPTFAQPELDTVRHAIPVPWDADRDGIPNPFDSCPFVRYNAGFDWGECDVMDRNPDNDRQAECKARERVLDTLLGNGAFTRHIAFSIVKDGELHFADAFEYVGGGQWAHAPQGIHRLYRIGSTSKAVTATAAKVLEENGVLSLADFVNDDDATKIMNGERSLRDLLTHQGAFRIDAGAIHLFCYAGDLAAFWAEPDDLVSPHFDSSPYGNLGGGFEYSAFNYSLAGAYLTTQTQQSFESLLQSYVFDAAGMCTATLDGSRAVSTTIGGFPGVSEGPVMDIGPYINLTAPTDPRCEDNFYSSDDLPGDPYDWLYYHLDEADGQARDPAGGVIASVVDMAHFAESLLASYHGQPNGILSSAGVRDLWTATYDYACAPNCAYEPYYGVGFFTNSLTGNAITEVQHGGSRAGFASAFLLRPESNMAVAILANADVSTVLLSDIAKQILDDFE